MKLLQTSRNQAKTSMSGFTLIEVMVSVAILGILAGLAVPSFSAAIQRHQINAVNDDLIASMQLARSEAIRRGLPVTLIRSTGCGIALVGADSWNCGWLVFAGTIADGADATAAEQAAAIQVAGLKTGYTVDHAGGGRRITFNRWGAGAAGRFTVTKNGDGTSSKSVCISSVGRTRIVEGSAC